MYQLVSTTGDVVPLGRMVQAVAGPYMGTWWRLDDLRPHTDGHLVSVSRKHRVGRHTLLTVPEIFGLTCEEVLSRIRHGVARVHHTWQRLDEWFMAGVIALVPLAVFEAYHGGDALRGLLDALFNSQANTGGH